MAATRTLTNMQGPTTATEPSAYQSMSSVYPNLTQTGAQASQNILANLRGELSPETINTIQDEAARFGITSGIPMSTLAGSRGLSRLGLTSQQVQEQGLQDFLNTLKSYAGTVTPTSGELISQELGRGNLQQQAANLAEQSYQFGKTFPEQQREFDIENYLRNQQFYAGLGPSYLSAMGSYLNYLS